MIWRLIYYAICTLALAGLVHIAIILLVPAVGTKDAYAVISNSLEPLSFKQIEDAGSGALLADVDPFFSYGVCRFELGSQGMAMSGPKTDNFWSATVLDDNGAVVYSLNERTAVDNKLDLILLNPLQILQLREVQPPEAETAIIVEADMAAGFVVLRVLRPDDTWDAAARAFLKSVSCKPYLPGQDIAPPDKPQG